MLAIMLWLADWGTYFAIGIPLLRGRPLWQQGVFVGLLVGHDIVVAAREIERNERKRRDA